MSQKKTKVQPEAVVMSNGAFAKFYRINTAAEAGTWDHTAMQYLSCEKFGTDLVPGYVQRVTPAGAVSLLGYKLTNGKFLAA